MSIAAGTLILVWCVQHGQAAASDLTAAQELTLFLRSNLANPLTMTCTQLNPLCLHLFRFLAMTSLVQTRLIVGPPQDLDDIVRTDTELFVVDHPLPEEVPNILRKIGASKIRSSLMYFPSLSQSDRKGLEEELSGARMNSHFFLAQGRSSPLSFYRVISMRNQSVPVIDKVDFLNNSYFMKDRYDLQGMNIMSITESWSPLLTFDDCNDLGDCSTAYGLVVDMCDAIAKMFNFTVTNVRQRDGDWGMVPIEGPFNLSGTWGGIMGNVIMGNYPLSASVWSLFIERQRVLDFVPFMTDGEVLVLTPRVENMDMGMFVRPFTRKSWHAVGAVSSIALTLMAIDYLGQWYAGTSSFKVASLTMWYVFVLLNAFYGGALTMFFITEEPIPFNNMREVIAAYPEWNFIFQRGKAVKDRPNL